MWKTTKIVLRRQNRKCKVPKKEVCLGCITWGILNDDSLNNILRLNIYQKKQKGTRKH